MRSVATTSRGEGEANERRKVEADHREASVQQERRNENDATRTRNETGTTRGDATCYNQPGLTRGWHEGKCNTTMVSTRARYGREVGGHPWSG